MTTRSKEEECKYRKELRAKKAGQTSVPLNVPLNVPLPNVPPVDVPLVPPIQIFKTEEDMKAHVAKHITPASPFNDVPPEVAVHLNVAPNPDGPHYTVDRDAFDKLTRCYPAAADVCYGGVSREAAIKKYKL